MDFRLPRRLLAAAKAVRPGSPAADVGCDHGLLSAWLALEGGCPRVIATDINPGPLAAAQRLVERLGLAEKVELRLGDGLTPVGPGEVEDVVIAGMGAELIARIIDGAPWLRDGQKQLVLVPASRHGRLREYLNDSGFEIMRELAVHEAGQAYTIITARWDRLERARPLGWTQLGELRRGEGDFSAYAAAAQTRLERRIAGLRSARTVDAAALKEAVSELEYLIKETGDL